MYVEVPHRSTTTSFLSHNYHFQRQHYRSSADGRTKILKHYLYGIQLDLSLTVPIVQEAGWAPGPVWTGKENLVFTGIRYPDRAAQVYTVTTVYSWLFISKRIKNKQTKKLRGAESFLRNQQVLSL
jgi:hypothetical protein